MKNCGTKDKLLSSSSQYSRACKNAESMQEIFLGSQATRLRPLAVLPVGTLCGEGLE